MTSGNRCDRQKDIPQGIPFPQVRLILNYSNRKLDPKLSESEVFELVKTSLDCYIPLPPGGVKKGKEETYEDHLESETFMQLTQEALHDLMCQIILKDPTPDGLDSVFKVRKLTSKCENRMNKSIKVSPVHMH